MLGLPTDCNSSHLRGVAAGPAAIRSVLHSGMSNLCAENGTDLARAEVFIDLGDLPLQEAPGDFAQIVDAVASAAKLGPVVALGGDHFVTWPQFEGLRQAGWSAPHLLHVDAHPDLYPDFDGNPRSHASPMARIMERGLAASLTQVGIRTVNAVQRAAIDAYGVAVFPPAGGLPGAEDLPRGPTWFSIDLDGLDPAFAPGVSHHEPGGLSVRDVIELIWRAPGPVIGGDIVEYNPARDINEMTAAVAGKLLKELVARIVADQ